MFFRDTHSIGHISIVVGPINLDLKHSSDIIGYQVALNIHGFQSKVCRIKKNFMSLGLFNV